MKNKLKIQEKLLSIGMTLGCYDKEIEKLSVVELQKVLNNMEFGSGDIGVKIRRKDYIVEVYHVDNEVDFNLMEPKEYAQTYGRIFHQD